MDNKKSIIPTITDDGIGEITNIMSNQRNPTVTYTTLSQTRTQSPPLMGTSARAAKRRMDGDTGLPMRVDGTDTYNQQLQHHYQNVRQILDEQKQQQQQQQNKQSNELKQTSSIKQDISEQQSKSTPLTYDSPPREQQPAQKIITTITTTTTTTGKSPIRSQTSSPLNDSLNSTDRLLEQAAELQKTTNINPIKNDSSQPLVIERTEQYQVFFDPTKPEIRRTPSIPKTKTSHSTDLDQAQTHVDQFLDDHQAIQQLTRVLQEHNTTTLNEYKRLPSQTNSILINTTTTTTTTIPSNIILVDRTNQPSTNEFTVIDALLSNPLGTNNNKQNNTIHVRYNDILTNLRNSEYVNTLKQSIEKKKSSLENEKTPLLSSKEKKKQNKKKSKQLSENKNYEVIDALINNPIIVQVPNSLLNKYQLKPVTYQLSSTSLITNRDNNILLSQQLDTKAKTETVHDLVKVVNELQLHHPAAPTTSSNRTTNELQQSIKPISENQNFPIYATVKSNHQSQTSSTSTEPIKPRIIYRYMDEQGNILKISQSSPSDLRITAPVESQEKVNQNIEPQNFHSRHIVVNNGNQHFISEREQRTTGQIESKFPTTITRNDLELKDKRIPKLTEQPLSTTARTIPILIEREHTIRSPFQEQPLLQQQQQQHTSYQPNQSNVQLSWLPLSYQLDQPLLSGGTAGYDTDSSTSEPSTTYRPYDFAPIDTNYRYPNRPLFQNIHHHHKPSPIHPYHHTSSHLPYANRNISPDSHGNSISRNYIEIFRDGETKPSVVYSLPYNEMNSSNQRHSRYDQYHTEKSRKTHVSSPSPHTKHERTIPSLSSYGPYSPHTLQSSPHHDQIHFDNYIRPSKSFDYRPLRTKLEREYKITPSLLVDEWEHPNDTISTGYNKHTSISSPDDVFTPTNNRTNKA